MIELIIQELPPSINHYWLTAGKRRYISKEGLYFRQLIHQSAKNQRIEGRLQLYIELTASNKRKWDCDNRVKAVQDALQHAGVFDDDEQIDRLVVYRMTIAKSNKTRIVISQIEG